MESPDLQLERRRAAVERIREELRQLPVIGPDPTERELFGEDLEMIDLPGGTDVVAEIFAEPPESR